MQWDCVVLAAGRSSRFAGGKLLAPWKGGVLLDGALRAAFAAPVRRVTVVWGADPRVPAAAEAFARLIGESDRLCLVKAETYAEGMAASLKTAIAALDPDSAGAFIVLGDMPRIPTELATTLAGAVAHGASAAAPVHAGRRGHPVLFSSTVYPALMRLSGDRGAAGILDDLGAGLMLVPSDDDGVLYDIDRPQDLRAIDLDTL